MTTDQAIKSMEDQIRGSKDKAAISALRAAIASLKRSSKKGPPKIWRTILYLVCPCFNGKPIGYGKFGFIRIPADCLDWVAHIRKNCAERYGTPYKDAFVFM